MCVGVTGAAKWPGHPTQILGQQLTRPKTNRVVNKVKHGFLLAAFLLSLTINTSQAGIGQTAPASIQVLSEIRNQAIAEAGVVADACRARQRCGTRYGFYRMTYNRTATAFDTMISSMINQLKRNGSYKRSLYFRHAIDDAAVRVSLLKMSYMKLRGHVAGGTATATSGVNPLIDRTQTGLRDSFGSLRRTYLRSGTQQRRRLISMLQALRWDRFDEVRPISTVMK